MTKWKHEIDTSIPFFPQRQLSMEMGDHIFQPGMHPPQANLEADQSTHRRNRQKAR